MASPECQRRAHRTLGGGSTLRKEVHDEALSSPAPSLLRRRPARQDHVPLRPRPRRPHAATPRPPERGSDSSGAKNNELGLRLQFGLIAATEQTTGIGMISLRAINRVRHTAGCRSSRREPFAGTGEFTGPSKWSLLRDEESRPS